MNLLFGRFNWCSSQCPTMQESHRFNNGMLDLHVERIHNFNCDNKNFFYNENTGVLCGMVGYVSSLEQIKSSYSLKSEHDVEIIEQGYSLKGPTFISELDGIFSIFIWDKEKQQGYLFQDEYGSNLPMYYTYTNTGCVFSTNLKQILKSISGKRELNISAVRDLLYCGLIIPHEATLISNIYKLLPSQYIVIDGRGQSVKIETLSPKEELVSKQFAKENLIASISRCVEKLFHLLSYKDITCALTSGFDSNLVLHCLTNLTYGDLEAVTIGGSKVNEIPFAGECTRQHKNVKHTGWLIKPSILDFLPDYVWRNEGYFYTTGSLFLEYELANRLKDKGVRCIFLGDCANQQVDCYRNSVIQKLKRKIRNFVKSSLVGDAYYIMKRRPVHGSRTARLLKDFRRPQSKTKVDVYLQWILKKGGILLNSHGIQGIYPFLNRDTKRFSRSLWRENANRRFYKEEVKKTLGLEKVRVLSACSHRWDGIVDTDFIFEGKDKEGLAKRLLGTTVVEKLLSKRQIFQIAGCPEHYLRLIWQLLYLYLFDELFITGRYDSCFDDPNCATPLSKFEIFR